MEQLSGADALLVLEEAGNVHNHVSGLGFYDMADVPGGALRFRDILAHFERRLGASKAFRRRLVTVPHDIDRPYWVQDSDVDLEFHVRHIALPAPGDWRQLMIQVARLHSHPLDLGKPLWEVYVIEGLENIPGLPASCFAVLYKFHAAALDGQAIAQIIRDVHGKSPLDDDALPANDMLFSDAEPGTLSLYSRAVVHHAGRTARLAGLYGRTLAQVARMGTRNLLARVIPRHAAQAAYAAPVFSRAPSTRFDGVVSPARVVECVDFAVADVADIRNALPQASTGDVVLATLSGALRAYLRSKNELPVHSLRALVPYAIRQPGFAGQAGPGATGLPVPLATDLREPLQRLAAIHEAQCRARQGQAAELGRNLLPELLADLPNRATHHLLQRGLLAQVNGVASYAAGPRQPMYLAGARATRFYPLGRIADHATLNVSAIGYDERLWVAVVACRDAMPDPAAFADHLKTAFAELHTAALRRAASRRNRAAPRKATPPTPEAESRAPATQP